LETGAKTLARYSTVVSQFKAFLASRALRDIATIRASEIASYRDHLAKKVASPRKKSALRFGQPEKANCPMICVPLEIVTLARLVQE
jgi:hypothetical protein